MRVAFLSPSVSRTGGGIFEIVRSLAQALVSGGHAEVDVYGLTDEFSDADRPAWGSVPVHTFPARGLHRFGYAPELQAALMQDRYDLVHLHALWQHASIVTSRYAQRRQVPSIITLNGMLDPWAVQHSPWRKRVAWRVFERANVDQAACIQVNTLSEAKSAKQFGLANRFAVIPNGILLPDRAETRSVGQRSDPKRLLYLGRLHAKKNLIALVEAVALLGQAFAGWQLDIVGWDQGNYAARIRECIAALGLDGSVAIHEPEYGAEKDARLCAADAFILPSHSEGLPMAVLEAWSHAKPVVMTAACNLEIGFTAGAALECDVTAEGIAKALSQLLTMPDAERTVMGRSGRALVERQFTWPSVADDMAATYRWVLGQADAPKCLLKE